MVWLVWIVPREHITRGIALEMGVAKFSPLQQKILYETLFAQDSAS